MSEKTPFGKRSYAFAIGRVRVREASLLDKSQWNRLLEADEDGALQALREFGYGAAAQEATPGKAQPVGVDALISAELGGTAAFIDEITADRELTDLFLLPTDGHNLKALLKSRLLHRADAADGILLGGGSIPVDVLNACVSYEDLSPLPSAMAASLTGIWEEESPRVLSARVDRAVFEQCAAVLRSHPCTLLNRYFAVWVEYLNLLAAQRGQRLGWSGEQIAEMLLPPLPGPRGDDDMERARQGETLRETERNMERALLAVVREEKGDPFGIAPIVCYLLEKRNEARNLRVLFAAKRSGIPITTAELDF